MPRLTALSGLLACASSALAAFPKQTSLFVPPALSLNDVEEVVSTGNFTFEQLIDHNAPELGTFSQMVWWSDEYWTGPGAPIVLFTPGEIAAAEYTGYLTNRTITGQFAQAVGGAVIMIEHRYWGDSSPYDVLTTENLQYLTLEQSIADLTYFAENVQLPFAPNGSTAHEAPWILSGGSYSGALSAWTASTSPGTFWAYHSSSAPVEAIYDFWQYFYPVQQGMPANCSKDVSLVIDYMDNVLLTGTDEEKYALKEMFGLQGVEHDDDFMSVLQNGPWSWQSIQFYSGYSAFYEWCDAIEDAGNGTVPGAEGVGLEVALAGYAEWVNSTLLPGYCASYGYWTDEWSVECFDTYNASSPFFTDMTIDNAIDRQWNWFLCNEPFAYWQDGAPNGTETIVSRLVTGDYWQRQCSLFFPSDGEYSYGSAEGKTVNDVNAWTGGWEIDNTTRLIYINGEFDPWRSGSTSSDFRPEGPLVSTAEVPVLLIPDGIHCSDLIYENAVVNDGVMAVVQAELAQMKEWVAEYNSTELKKRTLGFSKY